jgi:(p)ppGpp synthase/HD superfamily hydrolase
MGWFNKEENKLVEKAMAIAVLAHDGQKDKAGLPYILHPLRLAMEANTYEQTIVALLHDVVEDTCVTIEELAEHFSANIIEAIDILTKKKDQNYTQYLTSIKESNNSLAYTTKIQDLIDNTNAERMKLLDSNSIVYLQQKYSLAKEILLS